MSFDNNWRRKQEIRARPLVDEAYKMAFPTLVAVERFDDRPILDKEFAIDCVLVLDSGLRLHGQEKVLGTKYDTVTVEYEQNQHTGEHGDWFKLSVQFYFVGYLSDDKSTLRLWVMLDWPRVVQATEAGLIVWSRRANKKDGARASFMYTPIKDLPESCILARHVDSR